jgi:hypothetical protein
MRPEKDITKYKRYWTELDRYVLLKCAPAPDLPGGWLVFDMVYGAAVLIEDDEVAALVKNKMKEAGAREIDHPPGTDR